MLTRFNRYDKNDLLSRTHLRRYETKLGETIQCDGSGDIDDAISRTSADYVLFGIPEDIGIKANLGTGGSDTLWSSFLESFLNIQNNDFLAGESIFLAGHFDFSDAERLINVNAAGEEEKISAYRSLVSKMDDVVEELVKIICQHKKIPVIVGGGHNNAYPAIKGAAKGLYKAELIPLAQINCVNLDAHADYRSLEGRHSGNAFRYADEDGYLNKYCVVGIHENYVQQTVLDDMTNSPFIHFISYEDIFIREKQNFIQAVAHATGFTEDNYTGIELDLDAVENVLTSAATPCGVSALQARQYVDFVAVDSRVAYVHICEGATKSDNGESSLLTGKLVSYLVSDFVKSHKGRP